MKKFLKLIAILFLLAVIALVAVGFYLGPIVKKAVNTVGPKLTGTRVELADAKISPLTGSGELAGLFVGNPEGWSGDKAFYLGKVRSSLQPNSLLGGHVILNEVVIDSPEFVYERRLMRGSNIDALLKQIQANTSGGQPAPDASGQAPAPGKPLKFSIKSLRVENAKMSVIAAGQTLTVPLPPLTLTNLGVAEGGITSDQVASAVLNNVLAEMTKAAGDGVKAIGAAALDAGAAGLKEAKDSAKGALDKVLGR